MTKERLDEITTLLEKFDKFTFDVLNDKNLIIDRKQVHQPILFFQVAKMHTTFGSVIILCKEMLGFDALILSRSMLNNLINAAWINNKKRKERAERFLEYSFVLQKRFLDKLKKYPQKPKILEVMLQNEKQILENYENLKNKFSKNKNDWADISIEKRANEVGLSWDYDIVYFTASSYEHSDVMSSKYFITKLDEVNKLLEFKGGPSEEYVEQSAVVAFKYMLNGVEILTQVFSLYKGYKEKFQEFVNEFGRTFKKGGTTII